MANSKILFRMAILLIMIFACVLTIIPIASFAVEKSPFTYSMKGNGTAIIDKYNWAMNGGEDIYIPEMIDGYAVTAIGDNAFSDEGSRMSKAVSIHLPSAIKTIGSKAFFNTAIKSINIPASVEMIGSGAFASCKNIKGFTVDPQNNVYAVIDGVLYNKKSKKLVSFPAGKDIDIISFNAIPEGIISIGEYAFYGIDFGDRFRRRSSQFIPETVSEILDYAFYECSGEGGILSYCQFPLNSSVQYIGDYAFANSKFDIIAPFETDYSGIGSDVIIIKLPKTVSHVGSHAFDHLKSGGIAGTLDLSETKLTVIEEYAFCNIDHRAIIKLPESLEVIKTGAFENTNISSIVFPKKLKEIQNNAFAGALKENKESGRKEPKYAFDSFGFQDGSELEYIGERAFCEREIRFFNIGETSGLIGTIILPNSLKEIGRECFSMCTGIEHLSIPESVSFIGDNFCDRTAVVLDIESGSYAALYAEENGYMTLSSYNQDASWLNE